MSDPNVTATPSPAEAISSAPVASPTLTPTASPVASPQVPAAAPIAAPEDRSNWVPPHRIREVREGMQRQFAQQQAQLEARVQQQESQLRALTGIQPPPNPEVATIKQQFDQVFGEGASDFFSKREQIDKYLERMEELEVAVDHIWRTHGRQSVDRVFKQAEEALGSPLSEEGRRVLHTAFSGWIQSVDPTGERYVSDPTIVDEFWKTLSSTLVDPARRIAAANVQNRAPGALPQDTPAGVPAPMAAPKPANLDERVANGWAMLQATRK